MKTENITMKAKRAVEENEQLLKQVALTINANGISDDLKYFIKRKIAHNKNNLNYLTQMISIQGDQSKLDKSNPLTQFLTHILKEIKITDMALDLILQNLTEREVAITIGMNNKKGKV